MTSSIPAKISAGHFVLLSAAFLINASSVLADDRVSDAQGQARDLLSGAVAGPKAINRSVAVSVDHYQKSHADPQKQARQIILGKPSFDDLKVPKSAVQSKTNVPVPEPARPQTHDHPDAQESARRIILGKAGHNMQSTGTRLSRSRQIRK
jgi:hypothetical protein